MYNVYKLVFRPCKIKIVTLNYDHIYLQLFMLNNDTSKIVYDN